MALRVSSRAAIVHALCAWTGAGQEPCEADGSCQVIEEEASGEAGDMKTSLLQLQQHASLAASRQGEELQGRRSQLLRELADIEGRLGEEPDVHSVGASYSAADGLFPDTEERGSCEKFGCGPFVRGQGCQCNDDCKLYGSCCYDYDSKCAILPTPAPTYGVFDCEATKDFGEVVMPEAKGLALDDTTFENCADEIPTHWPNTKQKILSMRLFKPWGMTAPKWFHGDMHKAWKGLKGFAQASGTKFLIGVSVTCQQWNDDKEFAAGLRFIQYVGAEHIMGLAIGNEIDLQIGAANGGCINYLWNQGGYEKTIRKRVAEFEKIPGMKGKPISAVLSMQSMQAYPFIWKVKGFLKRVWKEWGDRFVMSINVYPQFNAGLRRGGCHGAAMSGTSYETSDPDNLGFMPNLVKDIRKRMATVGGENMKLWVGETGWATHAYCVLGCWEACNSKATQERFYTGFLKWDLVDGLGGPKRCGKPTGKCLEAVNFALTDGIYGHPEWYPGLTNESSADDFQDHMANQDRAGCPHTCAWEEAHPDQKPILPVATQGAEHVFYFTLRDSYVFGKREEFGIVERCGSKRCKF
eukprot:TRINITY_DN14_c0_g2_i1.p1 TRINITY_DN14_c0_g2~~TRINITY_DN14_c0_g2_i1.p1  ORF type:complete len:580 (-),score=137.24 TRINITY_DN14_c0_g2_i1:396-2135(-)